MLREAIDNVHKWISSDSFGRNAAILTGGTVFAQGIMAAALPVLTRLYSPSDFSTLAVYAALVGMVSVIACMRYNIAIPLPEDDADGLALLVASVLLALCVSALCALPIILVPRETAAMIGLDSLLSFLWMIPVGVFVASTYDAVQYWTSRRKRFLSITGTRVTRATCGSVTQLAAGVCIPSSPAGLLFGHLIYLSLGIVGLLRGFVRHDKHVFAAVSKSRVIAQARTYRRFPIYSVPEALLNTAANELPIVLIAATVGGPEAGLFFLAMRVMGIPMALIGGSVAQVYLADAGSKLRDGTLGRFTRATMWSLFKIGAPPMLIVAAASPMIFPMVFGAEWERAGWLVVWMTPWFILQFVASPVSMVIHVLGRQKVACLLHAFGFISRVGAVLIAGRLAESHMPEWYAVASAMFYLCYLYAIARVIRHAAL